MQLLEYLIVNAVNFFLKKNFNLNLKKSFEVM